MKLIFWLFLLPSMCLGMDRFSALSMLETGDDDTMVGRAGEISRYQIMKNEWHSVNQTRNYRNPAIARQVAEVLMQRRVAAFEKTQHRSPNDFEVYVLWNAPAQALKGRISPVVAERAQRYSNLCNERNLLASLSPRAR